MQWGEAELSETKLLKSADLADETHLFTRLHCCLILGVAISGPRSFFVVGLPFLRRWTHESVYYIWRLLTAFSDLYKFGLWDSLCFFLTSIMLNDKAIWFYQPSLTHIFQTWHYKFTAALLRPFHPCLLQRQLPHWAACLISYPSISTEVGSCGLERAILCLH